MALIPLPRQAEDIPWPTVAWPRGDLAAHVDQDRLNGLLDHAFSDPQPDDLNETHAFVAVHRGRLVAQRYWRDHTRESTQPSWSKAKSITHALIGVLVKDGVLDIYAPADVPEWQEPGDSRGAITLDQLLRMRSGLHFAEDYVDAGVSHVIEMLFGKGKEDTAAYAAALPLAHEPDTVFNYASGTSNIIARIAARAIGKTGADFEAFMHERLFGPLGIRSAMPKFDGAGTFIGSSFCYCTPEDFARFGLLYLRDGVWEGHRILPEGWVDYARTFSSPAAPPTTYFDYGAHWWLGLAGPNSFSANGYQGQFTVCVPELDLILIRHGLSMDEAGRAVHLWLSDVADCFRP